MILITIGLMCLFELKKEQQDKNGKNSAEKFFLIKNVFYCVVLKQKNMFYLKKTFVLKTSSHLYRVGCVFVCRAVRDAKVISVDLRRTGEAIGDGGQFQRGDL